MVLIAASVFRLLGRTITKHGIEAELASFLPNYIASDTYAAPHADLSRQMEDMKDRFSTIVIRLRKESDVIARAVMYERTLWTLMWRLAYLEIPHCASATSV